MTILDTNMVKLHLHVDHDTEDDLIKIYVQAAEEAAMEYLNRQVYKEQTEVDAAIDDGADRPMLVNASFKAAVLYAVGAMYMTREDASAKDNEFPQYSRRCLDPFRIHQGV